jgi:hypothetical protein
MPRCGNVRTAPKQVWLTDLGRADVEVRADRRGISFSAEIETLARIGLGLPPREAIAPALAPTVRRYW